MRTKTRATQRKSKEATVDVFFHLKFSATFPWFPELKNVRQVATGGTFRTLLVIEVKKIKNRAEDDERAHGRTLRHCSIATIGTPYLLA